MKRMFWHFSCIGLVVGLSMVTACHPERPEGWTEETHGPDAEPNYAVVFSQDEVKRFDVVIDPADWQAMLDDMTEMHGEFGVGGHQTHEVPPEILQACEGLSEGDECVVTLDDGERHGECGWLWEDVHLGCDIGRPDQGPTPEMIAACEGRMEGDVCDAPTPAGARPGNCLLSEILFCAPNEMITACRDLEAGDECSIQGPPGAPSGTCTAAGVVVFCAIKMPGGEPGGVPEMGSERDPIWVPCEVRFQGKTWWHIGIRFKGNSSLKHVWQEGSYKLPFKFDFDEFEDQYPSIEDQRFYGFKRLSFANNHRDSSYLHENVAGDLFREGGVPAPHRAFYMVFFDVGNGPIYFGLYTMAEVPDRPMFLTQFGASGGNLYKPAGDAATWQKVLPIDEMSFSKKTNETDADWSDVKNAIAALHASWEDTAAWRAEFERHFNADGFLRWLAINTVIQDWDTYGNGPHNYYLYGDPADNGRLHWIPWDHSESLKSTGGMRPPLPLDMSTVDEQWPLIRFLLDDTVYEETYWGYVREFTEGVFSLGAIRARLQAEHDLIAPYVVGAEGEQAPYTLLSSPDAFDTSLGDLFDHVDNRHDAVRRVLGL